MAFRRSSLDYIVHGGVPGLGGIIMSEEKTTMESHEKPHPYLQTFIALTVITIVEVAVSYLDKGPALTAVLMLLAVAKAVLVGAIFMHIAYDKQPRFLVIAVFIVPLLAGSILLLSIMMDWRGFGVS